MVLDLLCSTWRSAVSGVFGSARRAYENTEMGVQRRYNRYGKLLFGMGQYSGFRQHECRCVCIEQLLRAADYHRHCTGFCPPGNESTDSWLWHRSGRRSALGLTHDNFEDGGDVADAEAYMHPRTAGTDACACLTPNWWGQPLFRRLQTISFTPKRPAQDAFGKTTCTWPGDLCRNTREQVNITTYRTPDYMLSCAQDYRPIWW